MVSNVLILGVQQSDSVIHIHICSFLKYWRFHIDVWLLDSFEEWKKFANSCFTHWQTLTALKLRSSCFLIPGRLSDSTDSLPPWCRMSAAKIMLVICFSYKRKGSSLLYQKVREHYLSQIWPVPFMFRAMYSLGLVILSPIECPTLHQGWKPRQYSQ